MKILITGGCGFVGSNLAILFKKEFKNCDVFCLDNLSRRGSEINLIKISEHGCNFIHGDVRVRSDFEKVPKVDLVIDAAAEPSVLAGSKSGDLEYLVDTNLIGTINNLHFANNRNIPLVFLSTSRVYPYNTLNNLKLTESSTRFNIKEQLGVNNQGINEEYSLEGLRTLYGATKLSSEYLIKEFSNNFNIPCIINRCGVLSGPYQMGKIDQGVIVLWMAKHFWKKKLDYIGYSGTGKQVRDVLHIKDLFNLLKWQISNIESISGEIFNVGGGIKNSVSLRELTDLCQNITKNKIEIGSVTEDRPGDLPYYVTDNSKIFNKSGWKPEISINQILIEIYDWIEKDQKILKKILS